MNAQVWKCSHQLTAVAAVSSMIALLLFVVAMRVVMSVLVAIAVSCLVVIVNACLLDVMTNNLTDVSLSRPYMDVNYCI